MDVFGLSRVLTELHQLLVIPLPTFADCQNRLFQQPQPITLAILLRPIACIGHLLRVSLEARGSLMEDHLPFRGNIFPDRTA